MQPTDQGVVPFNFFAGTMPSALTPLAWVTGWDYCITSITVQAPASDGAIGLTIVDAGGHVRWYDVIDGTKATAPIHITDQLLLVMGGASGAKLQATAAAGWCSIDGFALTPLSSAIVTPLT